MSRNVRILQRAARQLGGPVADIPTFLCPGILSTLSTQPRVPTPLTPCEHHPGLRRTSQQRYTSSMAVERPGCKSDNVSLAGLSKLPQQCAGCGAFTQNVDDTGPGYFTLTRGSVKSFLGHGFTQKSSAEDAVVKQALQQAGSSIPGFNAEEFSKPAPKTEPPVCDRCHKLRHHETGMSIHHPSIENLYDTISESPFKYNHVYHVLDAADFPMSLIPGLEKALELTPQRSKNRRSKTGRFIHGRKTDVSFIITRSDLFAPAKSQVDSMMPYLQKVLRDALGRLNRDVRLGNIRCVSAKQAWWTRELKEEIWRRGGAGWMVGKVNVGKSQLFHNVFPKGRREAIKLDSWKPPSITTTESSVETEASQNGVRFSPIEISAANTGTHGTAGVDRHDNAAKLDREKEEEEYEDNDSDSLDTSMLLPPVPPEEDYPAMPLVSALPGTTASPIRLSFGSGKGELIDLPGLSRGDLELHVKPEFRPDLVMRSRIKPEQQVIKPGQSILLGGFIRITPTNPDIIIMSYSFTPIKSHLTSTEKAIGTQLETRESNVENIALPGTGSKIKSAGIFPLKWDVTKQRAGPVTSSSALNISPERLPYRILATDILIEGCGWVELVAQVRRPRDENLIVAKRDAESDSKGGFRKLVLGREQVEAEEFEQVDPDSPAVEVFSPYGRYVGSRRPMNAWLYTLGKPGQNKLQGRPRRSMKGMKKLEKGRRRLAV